MQNLRNAKFSSTRSNSVKIEATAVLESMNSKGNAFLECIKDRTFTRKDNTTIKGCDLLKEKEFILVYIGASFLAGVGKRNIEILKDEKLEIIYLSQDNNAKEYEKHFAEAHGNWLGVPPGTKDNEDMMRALENPSKPHIIVFNKLGIMCKRSPTNKGLDSKDILSKWRARKENVALRRSASGRSLPSIEKEN